MSGRKGECRIGSSLIDGRCLIVLCNIKSMIVGIIGEESVLQML